MRTALLVITIALLAFTSCAVAAATEPVKPSAGFTFAELANNRLSDTRIGVKYDTMKLGFNALYFPLEYGAIDDDGEKVSSMAFGVYGEAETPALTSIGNVQLSNIWSGLTLKGFADLNVAYDPYNECMFVAPGTGVYVGATKYMSMAFRAYYPMSDDDDSLGGVDFNSMYFSLGLIINTK